MNIAELDDRLPTLQGDGLRLRWLTPADAPAVFELFSDPDVLRFTAVKPLITMGDAEEFIADIQSGFRKGDLYQIGRAHV